MFEIVTLVAASLNIDPKENGILHVIGEATVYVCYLLLKKGFVAIAILFH